MKKLSLFLTLSLLTLIGTSTVVKAEENQPTDAVTIPSDAAVEPLEAEDQYNESEVMTGEEQAEGNTEGDIEPSAQTPKPDAE